MRNIQRNSTKKLFAKRSFGQNFLVDGNYINKIINALNPQKDETIIEIGAGRGALTEKLVESGANIIAVEIERDMIAVLQDKFAENNNFQLIEADALKIDFSSFILRPSSFKLKLVANLPYYISTAILQKLIEQRDVFSEMILMFQKEVVERITAKVGNSERGFLTVLVENYLHAEKLFDVPPRAFRPAPKVNSAVIRLISRQDIDIDEKLFREIISAGFVQKRKTILNNLKNKLENAEEVLQSCGIDMKRRAESLTIEEWICLTGKVRIEEKEKKLEN